MKKKVVAMVLLMLMILCCYSVSYASSNWGATAVCIGKTKQDALRMFPELTEGNYQGKRLLMRQWDDTSAGVRYGEMLEFNKKGIIITGAFAAEYDNMNTLSTMFNKIYTGYATNWGVPYKTSNNSYTWLFQQKGAVRLEARDNVILVLVFYDK